MKREWAVPGHRPRPSRLWARAVSAAVVLGFLGACSAAGTPAPAGADVPTTAASAALAASASAMASATPGTSSGPSSGAGAPSAAPARKYDCKTLLTAGEMQQATGLASATFFHQELWTDTPGLPVGETYCQFFANQGGISIALTIATGQAFTVFEQALGAAGSAGEDLPGIGDHAVYVAAVHTGGARSRGVLVLLKFSDMAGSGFGAVDLKSATTKVLTIVVGRV